MSRRHIVWTESGRWRAVGLPETGAVVAGRAPAVDIVLADDSVSRRHASVSSDDAEATIENLSTTNPTMVNGAPVLSRTVLRDGDQIGMGNTTVTFHDLAGSDRLADLSCSNCARANTLNRTECWFCGTSLVNAPTSVMSKMPVRCRVIGVDGGRFDLFDGDVLVLPVGNAPRLLQHEAMNDHDELAIAAREGSILLSLGTHTQAASVGGIAAASLTTLMSGDEVRSSDVGLLVLIR